MIRNDIAEHTIGIGVCILMIGTVAWALLDSFIVFLIGSLTIIAGFIILLTCKEHPYWTTYKQPIFKEKVN